MSLRGQFARLTGQISRTGGRGAEMLLAVLSMAIAAVLCLQAASRYAFNHSLPWPDELAQVLLVWLTFLGGATAWRHGSHLGIGVLVDWLAGRFGSGWARAARSLTLAAGLLFFGVLLHQGLLLCNMLWLQRFPALGVTKAVSYAAIPLSAALMLVHSLALLLAQPESGASTEQP